jgi:hypothetical protein
MTKRTYRNAMLAGRDQPTTYRGYYIQPIGLGQTTHWCVERDGHVICRPNTLADAKRQIDELEG